MTAEIVAVCVQVEIGRFGSQEGDYVPADRRYG